MHRHHRRSLLSGLAVLAFSAGATTTALAVESRLPDSEPTGVDDPAEVEFIEDAVMFDDVDDQGRIETVEEEPSADDADAGDTADAAPETLTATPVPAEDGEAEQEHANHGHEVSSFAQETELQGRERGQAIADVARSNGEERRAAASQRGDRGQK